MAVNALVAKALGVVGTAGIVTTGVIFRDPIYKAFAGEKLSSEELSLPKECDLSVLGGECRLKISDLKRLKFNFGGTIKPPKITTETPDSEVVSVKWEKINGESNLKGNLMFSMKAIDATAVTIHDETPQTIIPLNSWMEFKVQEKEGYHFKQLEQSDKELSAGLKCKSNSCALSNDSGVVVKNSQIEKIEYGSTVQYSVSLTSDTSKDGYYVLAFNSEKHKWELSKIKLSKWDQEVLKAGTWTSAHDNSNKNITITVTEANKSINGSGEGTGWTWECLIKTNKNPVANLNLSTQETELKKKLGIDPAGSNETQEIKDQKRKFVENCVRNRSPQQIMEANKESLSDVSNKVSSTITLATDNTSFKNEDFSKLFNGEILGEFVKEQQ